MLQPLGLLEESAECHSTVVSVVNEMKYQLHSSVARVVRHPALGLVAEVGAFVQAGIQHPAMWAAAPLIAYDARSAGRIGSAELRACAHLLANVEAPGLRVRTTPVKRSSTFGRRDPSPNKAIKALQRLGPEAVQRVHDAVA